jgi:hypothetical protein
VSTSAAAVEDLLSFARGWATLFGHDAAVETHLTAERRRGRMTQKVSMNMSALAGLLDSDVGADRSRRTAR